MRETPSHCEPPHAQDVKDKLRSDFLSAYVAELAFWPAFQAVNFWKVPVRHQLLAVNLACLVDATFLCWRVPARAARCQGSAQGWRPGNLMQ